MQDEAHWTWLLEPPGVTVLVVELQLFIYALGQVARHRQQLD
jgi:hypothetical protein